MNIALYLLSFNHDTQDNFIDLLLNQKSSEYYTTGENYGKRKPLIGEVNDYKIFDLYSDPLILITSKSLSCSCYNT